MGVFLIRNTVTNRVFLASGQNLEGIINRHKFYLSHGSHKNKQLQADWNELGPSNFAFEVVEQMEPPSDGHFDAKQELRFMEDLWFAELNLSASAAITNRAKPAEKLRRSPVSARRISLVGLVIFESQQAFYAGSQPGIFQVRKAAAVSPATCSSSVSRLHRVLPPQRLQHSDSPLLHASESSLDQQPFRLAPPQVPSIRNLRSRRWDHTSRSRYAVSWL